MYPQLALFIDGEFISGGDRPSQDVINPGTLEKLGRLPHATRADLDRALAAAERALVSWRESSPMERSRVLRRVAELTRERAPAIAHGITLDSGKPLAESLGEVTRAGDHCEWHAEECRRIYGRVIPPRQPGVRQMVLREPIGVCAAFAPWNAPYSQSIRKIAAAIGAGCTIILKGPEESPSALMGLAEIFKEAGLPAGVLNLVWGVPAEVSKYLIESPVVRKVSFTGSVPVGKQLAALAGAHMKRVTMELGGHSPVLVFEDANVDAAADMLAKSKLRNAGQVCMAPTRFYLHDKIHDRFMAKFLDVVKGIKVGNGMDPATQMGPLIHGRRVEAMERFMEDAEARGGEILAGGSRLAGADYPGHFFAPTVVTGLPDDARLMTDEPFGPIAPMARFNDMEDVLRRANSLPYGLAAYVFTESLKTATLVSNKLAAGMVSINHFGLALAETPFGGVRDSGIGSEGGQETFDNYLVTKFVTQC